jgi:DNA polymerase (family 10)
MLSNKDISRALKLLASLLELHDENPFKVKSVQNAAFQIDRLGYALEGMSEADILAIPGIGKGMAQKIHALLHTGSEVEFDALIQNTPVGLVEMLRIKGLGAKKVRALWKELGIESPGELLYACNENRLVELSGFGSKTQENIRQAIEFSHQNQGKLHYANAQLLADQVIQKLQAVFTGISIEYTGALRRQCEVIEHIELLVLNNFEMCTCKEEGVFEIELSEGNVWQYLDSASGQRITLHLAAEIEYGSQLFTTTGPKEFIASILTTHELKQAPTEQECFNTFQIPYLQPFLRDWPLEEALHLQSDERLQLTDFRGILHCHSTWSDGIHSLEQMADAVKAMGMDYFGICDHSKSAGYAGGLSIERVAQQHTEIDRLNEKYSDFKIYKGIESDILGDGSLDYPDEVLKSFDFIVASVHSVLRMDEKRATERLIKAVENPYTTILGHPSGRLLLSRPSYPIDYNKLIDACAANGVSIELNAHPYRLDIDWRWIPQCMKKNVKISINPDAHRIDGLSDIRYGVLAAQKGGLKKEFLFNAMDKEAFERFLSSKK